MMNRLLIWVCAALLAVAAHPRAQQSDGVLEKLFASAEHKASVQGNLTGAIEDYERIVASSGRDRAAAAQALLRIAQVYRKLGDRGAERGVYRRIQSEFSDQKQAVEIASAAIDGASSGTVVWARAGVDVYGGLNTTARVSKDGRFVVYTDWTTGNLAVRETARNANRLLTKDADLRRNQYAGPAAFSPDGRRVAFAWLDATRGRYLVRVVGLDAEAEPQVLFDQEDVDWLQPYDWSRDGTRVALQIQRIDGTGQIALLNVVDGSMRVLTSFPWVGPSGEMRFSPDGRYLAFDRTGERDDNRELFVMPADGSCCQHAVVEHLADEQVLDWSPRGSELLFWSNRKGEWSLWSIHIASGKPSGAARLVRADLHAEDAFAPLGLTVGGDLFLATLRLESAGIKVAGVDLANGRVSTPVDVGVELANPFKAWTSYAWSPGGQTLAVFRRSAANAGVFSFKDYSTGTVRDVRARESDCAGGMVWSGDGRFFVCHGAVAGSGGRATRAGIIRVDVATGDARFLTAGRAPSLSPDSRTLYLLRGDQAPGVESSVIQFDLASGTERELLRRSSLYALQVSPDGRHLVARLVDGGTQTQSLLLVSVETAEARELSVVPEPGFVDALFWAPDSRSVLARRAVSSRKPIWARVSLDGTVTEYPELELGAVVRLNADASRVAYAVPKQVEVAIRRIEGVIP
jgi:Tol biopolymer transport system component